MSFSKRDMANTAILGIFGLFVLGGFLIVASLLGIFLLPFTLVFLFLLAVYFTRGYGFSGTTIILGILIFFVLGLGIHFVLGSVIGFDPVQTTYQSTLAAVKLDTVGSSISDATYSLILGFAVLLVVVALAVFGLFVSARKHR